MGKEAEHGWTLPLTIDSVRHINNAGAIPLRISEKISANDKGERYEKMRVTHDWYFPGTPGL